MDVAWGASDGVNAVLGPPPLLLGHLRPFIWKRSATATRGGCLQTFRLRMGNGGGHMDFMGASTKASQLNTRALVCAVRRS